MVNDLSIILTWLATQKGSFYCSKNFNYRKTPSLVPQIKLLPHNAFIGSISFGESFFSSRALCPGVLKRGLPIIKINSKLKTVDA
jgi:hypothetical protein